MNSNQYAFTRQTRNPSEGSTNMGHSSSFAQPHLNEVYILSIKYTLIFLPFHTDGRNAVIREEGAGECGPGETNLGVPN